GEARRGPSRPPSTIGWGTKAPSGSVDSEHQIRRQALNVGSPAEAHRRLDLVTEDSERARHTVRTVGAETPERGATARDDLRAAREPLHDVRAAIEAAVDDDLREPAHRVDDRRQRVDRALRVIELASAVVGHPDEPYADLDGA